MYFSIVYYFCVCSLLKPILPFRRGVSLDSQERAGEWLCEWAGRRGAEPEWAWRVLRALRLHRAHWRLPLQAPPRPPPPAPRRLLHSAFALLAGDLGHSVPLVGWRNLSMLSFSNQQQGREDKIFYSNLQSNIMYRWRISAVIIATGRYALSLVGFSLVINIYIGNADVCRMGVYKIHTILGVSSK